ncbi:hypothetical protein ACOMHN_019611 [Nucella lapillus]
MFKIARSICFHKHDIKPFFAGREKLMAPPVPGQSRLRIKALFDTMKERNSSMCSELNSSICTSNASFSEAVAETRSHSAKDCQQPREKENQTPSPHKDQDDVDLLAEGSRSPRNSHLPPGPQSPAMRVALNFAQHIVRLDGLSAAGALGSKNTARENTGTRPAPIVAVIDKTAKNNSDLNSCSPRKRHCNVETTGRTAPSTSRHLANTKYVTGSRDTRRHPEKAAENTTEEIYLPHCHGTEEETAVQSVRDTGNLQTVSPLAAFPLEPATGSPTDKTSDRSCADQETMQLVSKLVQRLQCSSEKNQESEDQGDSDDWDIVSKPVSSRSKGNSSSKYVAPPIETYPCFVKLNENMCGKTGGDVPGKNAVQNNKKTASDNKKKGSGNPSADKFTRPSTEEETKMTRTLRTRKRGLAVTESSHSEEQERSTRMGEKSVSEPRQKKTTGPQDSGDRVESDVITQQMVKPVESVKDPFSLDISSDEDDLHVEEDAITCATKKPGSRNPPRGKAAGDEKRSKAVSKAAGKEQKSGTKARVAEGGEKKGKVLKLSTWSLQPVSRLKSVRIEGKLPSTDYFWLSSVIMERVSSRILKSTNGSLYQLVGNMSVLNTRAAVWTPQGVMSRKMGATEVRRTQSGRCVIPPLARWAGQYLERDDDGNVTIGFTSLAAEQHFAKIAQHEMHAPLRLRNSPMCTRLRKAKTGNTSKGKSLSQQNNDKTAVTLPDSKAKENADSFSHNGETKKASNKAVDSLNTEMSLEEEVMSVIQKSKTERLQKAGGRKRTTCYSNAADGQRQFSNKTAPQSWDDADEDFVSQRNPGKGVAKGASVAKSVKQSAGKVTEKTGPKGRKQTKQQQSASPIEPKTISTRHRKPRQKGEVSDSLDEETTQSRSNTRSRTPKLPAAASRIRMNSEPIIISESSYTENYNEDDDDEPHPKKAVCSAPSSFLTAAVSSKNSRRRRGNTQASGLVNKNVAANDPNNTTKRKLQPIVNGARKKPDQESNRSSDEDLCRDESDVEKEVEKKGGRRSKAQNKSRSQRQPDHNEKGRKKTAQSKAKTTKSVRKENMPSADLDGSRPWSEEEIQDLGRGIESISSDHPEYWEAVSRYVEGRTSKECAAFYLKDNPEKGPSGKSKERKGKQASDDKTPVIRGKRGTLKRRQELRAVLEHDRNNNNSNMDDLFSATPFRRGKQATHEDFTADVTCMLFQLGAVDFSKTDEEVFGRNPNFFTPRMGNSQPVGRSAFSHTPASSRKTPSVRVSNSPWLTKDSAQKRDIDVYLHRLQKNKRQLTRSFSKKSQPCRDTEAGVPCSSSVRLFNQAPVPDGLFSITEEQSPRNEDDGEEEDYYYSEEEN